VDPCQDASPGRALTFAEFTRYGACTAWRSMSSWRRRPTARSSRISWACAALLCAGAASCVKTQPAADTADPGFPFGPSSIGTQPIAYVQDIKPIFDRDCLSCHGPRDRASNYSVVTYADVIAGQRPGDASSSLVVDCSPGGSMYRYFSGDANTEATMVFRWMVVYNARQSR